MRDAQSRAGMLAWPRARRSAAAAFESGGREGPPGARRARKRAFEAIFAFSNERAGEEGGFGKITASRVNRPGERIIRGCALGTRIADYLLAV